MWNDGGGQAVADFWRLAENYSGRVTVLDAPGEVIGAALKMRGRSYNTVDAESLAQARTDLLRLKPHLRSFETNYRPLLASGEACLALGWNGDAAALKAEGLPVQYVVPAEGAQVWEDDWAIAAGAPHPEVAAQEARYTRYATGNRAARRRPPRRPVHLSARRRDSKTGAGHAARPRGKAAAGGAVEGSEEMKKRR